MFRAIVLFSLRRRALVAALAALLVGYGAWSAQHAALDVLPEFAPPQAVIQTEAPGLAPEQVEALITQPLEAAIGGLAGLETLRSESIQGLSVVTAVFAAHVDLLAARQLLAERVAEAGPSLPQGVGPPKLSPLTSATMDVLKIGLVSDALSPMELRTLADWTLRPRLLMVPGVAHVNVFGGEVRQLQVQVHPEALLAHGVALGDVLAAAREASAVRGAGFVETANQRIPLSARGEPASAAALGETMIAASGGVALRLADVADVVEAAAPKFGDALVQGRPGVLLTMTSQWGANTMAVTGALETALAELAPSLAKLEVTLYPRLHRPANFIESSLGTVRRALLLGSVLVSIVLVLFLRDPRTAFISLLAIPLSLLSAVIVLRQLDVTLNTMTLGGLAIAIGEVVDDAIVDVENIARRLRENRRRARPRPTLRVVLDASLEVRTAIVYATASVAFVFVPLLTLPGLAGSFFAPLAQSYLLAILASLAMALTVTPALSLLLLGRGGPTADPPLQARLKRGYARLLARIVARPARLLAGIGLLAVVALGALPFVGGELLPDFREGHLVLQLAGAPGTSLGESLRLGRRVSQQLLALPGVVSVEQQVGRAEQGEDTWGPERSEFHVELAPLSGAAEARFTERVRALLDAIPGVQSEVLTFLGDRIRESISGETAELVVNLFGDDLDVLDAKAGELAALLSGIRGAADVVTHATAVAPQIVIEPRAASLRRFGFRPAEVLAQLETAYQGTAATQLHRGSEIVDVLVLLDPASRADPDAVGALLVSSAAGARLPLRELADVRIVSARNAILHEGGRRRQTVTSNVIGRDVASFAAEAQRAVAERLALPAGVYAVFAGSAEARADAQRELLLRAALSGIAVVLLLGGVARHPRNLGVLLLNLPFALAGGMLAVAASTLLGVGHGLSLGSLVGFVTLFGITSRNAIMMLSHFQHLVDHEGAPWGLETALRGASERVVPVVMTALVTGLGLLPIALAAGRAGGEIDGPMAIVILGGIASSTLLTLLVLPLLCLRFGRFEGPIDDDREELTSGPTATRP